MGTPVIGHTCHWAHRSLGHPLAARSAGWRPWPLGCWQQWRGQCPPAGVPSLGCSWCFYLGPCRDGRNVSHAQLSNKVDAGGCDSGAALPARPPHPEELAFLSGALKMLAFVPREAAVSQRAARIARGGANTQRPAPLATASRSAASSSLPVWWRAWPLPTQIFCF